MMTNSPAQVDREKLRDPVLDDSATEQVRREAAFGTEHKSRKMEG